MEKLDIPKDKSIMGKLKSLRNMGKGTFISMMVVSIKGNLLKE